MGALEVPILSLQRKFPNLLTVGAFNTYIARRKIFDVVVISFQDFAQSVVYLKQVVLLQPSVHPLVDYGVVISVPDSRRNRLTKRLILKGVLLQPF